MPTPAQPTDPPPDHYVDQLMAELHRTVLATNNTPSVIVEPDIDLDVLLASLPPDRADKPSA